LIFGLFVYCFDFNRLCSLFCFCLCFVICLFVRLFVVLFVDFVWLLCLWCYAVVCRYLVIIVFFGICDCVYWLLFVFCFVMSGYLACFALCYLVFVFATFCGLFVVYCFVVLLFVLVVLLCFVSLMLFDIWVVCLLLWF